jgi:flagellar hook-length control protein FliK
VTSAVDIIAPKPAARPEPVAKDASRDDDRTTFAETLEAETAQPEAAAKDAPKEAAPKEGAAKEASAKDEPATPDTNAAAQPVQPQQQQPTPAVNSAQAILAGLTQAAPTDAPLADTDTATPAIDAAAAAPAAKPQTAIPQAGAATEETGNKPASPAAQAAATTAPADEATPLSAPGEERLSASVETATTSNNKTAAPTAGAATDPAANKAQGVDVKAMQAAANTTTTDAAPDLKADAPAPTTTTPPPLDALAAARTSATETVRAATPAMQNAPATTVQVYQRMVERFDGRAQRYEIRLDPAELGRVDVRIEVGADKKVHAVLAAHDSAALTDLMRGQRSLERALNDAGIDLAKNGIRFELSGDQGRNPANNFNDRDGNARSANVWRGFNTVDVAVDAQTAAAARPWRSSSRLDVVA